jgi:small-conductance mechanosensitive channel
VVDKPSPIVRFQDFGESGLEFELLFWTYNIWRIENLKSEIRFSIFESFKANNITIPFPQRDLHIRSNGKVPFSSEQRSMSSDDH